MSDRNVCPKCGGLKRTVSKLCYVCRNYGKPVDQMPVSNIDFIREAFEALVRACRGEVR